MFQRFLAEVVASQPVPASTAPSTQELIMAMSLLRAARQHRRPESVADTARAMGLDAGQLDGYLTDEGNLNTNGHVLQWLQTLPSDERAALLEFHRNR